MAQKSLDSFKTRSSLKVGKQSYAIYRLDRLEKAGFKTVSQLPVSLKILLENLLRHEDNRLVAKADVETLAGWNPKAKKEKEIAFMPARVLTQDLTGVPAVVDLAAMREAIKRMGGDPKKINPLAPCTRFASVRLRFRLGFWKISTFSPLTDFILYTIRYDL